MDEGGPSVEGVDVILEGSGGGRERSCVRLVDGTFPGIGGGLA